MSWAPVYRDGKIRAIRIAETGQQVVRWDGICDPVTDWGQNNARLVLAAPEMLELLEHVMEQDGMYFPDSPLIREMNRVIAKARGGEK